MRQQKTRVEHYRHQVTSVEHYRRQVTSIVHEATEDPGRTL
jgi:hypothetical protein